MSRFANKENGENNTWSDIEGEFYEAYYFWTFEFSKEFILPEHILSIQNSFSQCFEILQISDEGLRDYVSFVQNIESIRFVLTAASIRRRRITRQPLKEIHNK
jgi:hypothetical protein